MTTHDSESVVLPLFTTLFVYISYGVLIFLGHVHDTIDKILGRRNFQRRKVLHLITCTA